MGNYFKYNLNENYLRMIINKYESQLAHPNLAQAVKPLKVPNEWTK